MFALEVVRGAEGDDVVPAAIARARTVRRIVLAVWIEPEARLLLGRFSASPAGAEGRRHTGGRDVPVAPGDVRMALALPHRSATDADDPLALRPEQAMNRCVRGLLDACRGLGVDVHYPGRDVVTAAGVPVAWLSLCEEADGVALFEAGLGLGGRAGAPPADAAHAVATAYRRRTWDEVLDVEQQRLPQMPPVDLAWDVPAEADRTGAVPTMLGRLTAHVRLGDDRRVTTLRISGDVIAPVATMLAMEDALRGVPALRSEIALRVERTLADPCRWLLGVDGPHDVAAAVMEAAR